MKRLFIVISSIGFIMACEQEPYNEPIAGTWYVEKNGRIPVAIREKGGNVEITRCNNFSVSTYSRSGSKLKNKHLYENINIIDSSSLEVVNYDENGKIKTDMNKLNDSNQFEFGHLSISSDKVLLSRGEDVCAYQTQTKADGNYKTIIIAAPYETSYINVNLFFRDFHVGEFDAAENENAVTLISPDFVRPYDTTVLSSIAGKITLNEASDKHISGFLDIQVQGGIIFSGSFDVDYL